MPTICIVLGCGSRSNRDKLSFHAVPAETNFRFLTEKNELSVLRRASWIDAIKRTNLTPSILKNQKVCSKHFITGKPAALEDTENPDWIPSQHMGHDLSPKVRKRAADVDKKEHLDEIKKLKEPVKTEVINIEQDIDTPQQSQDEDQIEYYSETGVSTQTALTMADLSIKLDHYELYSKRMQALELKVDKSPFGLMDEESNDDKWEYYTGFKNKIVMIIFKKVEPFVGSTSALSGFNRLLLTLIKLRLGLHDKDLAYRFKISSTAASTYFEHVINILYDKFKSIIIWPDQPNLKSEPNCFKETFHDKRTIILDRFEVLIESPANLLTQQQCWSNYNHHHTIKFLIGITPQGSVCYISDAWGGRISDKAMVQLSDFCDKIKPGDVILAEKSFLISENQGVSPAKQVIPAFTKVKSQLLPSVVQETKQITHVIIHIERTIGLLKNKFDIFKTIIPVSMLKKKKPEKFSILDKAVIVCCALINLSPPIIP